MKTNYNLKAYFPVLFISFILMGLTYDANAQKHRNEGRKGNEKERKEYRESRHDDNRIAYNDRRSYSGRNYERKNWNDREYHPQYNKRYGHEESEYFEHPRYGRVYQKFDRRPIVLRHHRDNYYYYGNRFYTFRPGIGYCAIEFPGHTYFRQLPFACDEVYVHGQSFYRYGDLYFRLFPGGYMVVPSPFAVTITARF